MILEPEIGVGAYGEVRKAIHKASQIVRAVKIIRKDRTPKEE
jgi:calcium-dependent protein kinase